MQRLNLTAAPDQRVSAILDGRRMTLRFRFNVSDGRWYFDLALDDRPVVCGRRIVAHRNLIPGDAVPGRLFAYVYGSAPPEDGDLWFVDTNAADVFENPDELVGQDLIPFGLYDGRYFHRAGGVQPGLDSFASGAAALFYVSEAELTSALAAAA